jgi:hypothetical protein
MMTNHRTHSRIAVLGALCVALASACSQLEDLDGNDGGTGEDDDFASIYENATFQMCADCHAPGAPGRTAGTEATQNWSSSSTAFTSLKGKASGLVGNFAGCNGVPLVGATANTSLIVAVLDSSVRAGFSVSGYPACTGAAIVDETLRVGAVSPAALRQLKEFIDAGGFR